MKTADSILSFPRGIELTCACIVRNKDRKILLVASVKQGGKWTLPGGHVEPGEKIIEAAIREVKEETGLDAAAVETICFGELINPPDFHRPIHAVYFDCLLEADGKVILQADELSDFVWVDPEEALKMDLAKGYENDIRSYLAFIKRA